MALVVSTEEDIMLRDMAAIAAECVKRPRRTAIWSPKLRRYVCPTVDKIPVSELDPSAVSRPPISPMFKLVFVTAAAGTVLFIALCVTLTLLAGEEPPTLWTELIRGMFSLAQIGFGAIVGMLGGKRLEADQRAAMGA
jgi:hypothetical protein